MRWANRAAIQGAVDDDEDADDDDDDDDDNNEDDDVMQGAAGTIGWAKSAEVPCSVLVLHCGYQLTNTSVAAIMKYAEAEARCERPPICLAPNGT